jgi:hypothetical protein
MRSDGCGGTIDCGNCGGIAVECVGGLCECRWETCGATCCFPDEICDHGFCEPWL